MLLFNFVLAWFKLYFPLFWGMEIYDNEFEIKFDPTSAPNSFQGRRFEWCSNGPTSTTLSKRRMLLPYISRNNHGNEVFSSSNLNAELQIKLVIHQTMFD